MNYTRAERVADLVWTELADIMLRAVSDPRVRLVNVTGVKMSEDLRRAKIFFVERGRDECRAEVEAGMQRISGFLRRELGKRLQLRYLPELLFVYDTSFAYGSRIDRLLQEIHGEEDRHDGRNH